jgi:phosphatidylglycerophosphatase A|tara:strand:- start:115 stop:600 length:486 start_codon:yes stop_codon:yes gene_type:complete
MIKKFNILFLNLFNIGKIKYAPGTFASLFTCLAFLILNLYISIYLIFLFTLVIFFYSLIAINKSFELFDSKDPQEIVIDEFVGQMIPLLAIPIYETLDPSPKLYYCIAAFIIFRFFDIWKPFPISYIDKNTEGALGVMLDDILAGIFTIIVLTVFFFYLGA